MKEMYLCKSSLYCQEYFLFLHLKLNHFKIRWKHLDFYPKADPTRGGWGREGSEESDTNR